MEDKFYYEYDSEGKIKQIKHKDYDFFMWNYEEQTKLKHKVFEEYFDVFVKMLGKYHKLNFIDGFGGCGAYYDVEENKISYGSPVIAGETVKYKNKNRSVQLVIIEQNEDNIENLKKVVAHRKLISLNPIYIQGDFDEEINKILDNHNLAPTFFLVDPFGFKIKFTTLKRIIETDKSEIFFNFMFNSIQQFLTAPKMEENMNELFGCEDWKNIKKDKNREKEIVHLFVKQLKSIANFVFPFRLSFANKNRTYYYMIHVTNYWKACSIMKDCYAKHNNGKIEYYGADRIKSLPLFSTDEYINNELDNFLCSKYKGQKKKFSEILIDNIDCSEFKEKDFKNAIKRLKNTSKIDYTPIPALTPSKKEKRKIDGTDIIEFLC